MWYDFQGHLSSVRVLGHPGDARCGKTKIRSAGKLPGWSQETIHRIIGGNWGDGGIQ